MRCLTVASGLRERGVNIHFVCREHDGDLCDFIEGRGFMVHRLPVSPLWAPSPDVVPHASWLGATWQEDSEQTIAAIEAGCVIPDWLVVDHYAIDERWESSLRRSVRHIMAVDDLADRRHDCDILLDDNILPGIKIRYDNLVPANCKLLLGEKYVSLRDEFLELRRNAKFRTGPVRRVLVSFGGVDVDNYTGWVIVGLINAGLGGLAVDVVVGAQNPNRSMIQSICSTHGFDVHVQTDRIAYLMNVADLAIGSAGYTAYEFAAMKLPAILIPLSDVQTKFSKELEGRGVASVLAIKRDTPCQDVSGAILAVINSQALRASMSRACARFIDGKGRVRVVNELLHCGRESNE
jgi:UDP-2,4-diacetamido-2,4,6-trideoxy-beta-L-altropyranose hydrolase